MGSLLNRLLIILNDCDSHSTEYYIAMILLENYELIEALSIGEVANMCSVSKSAISKICNFS
jgi:DNA-binding MurR/RpiR family transcriptional regulator